MNVTADRNRTRRARTFTEGELGEQGLLGEKIGGEKIGEEKARSRANFTNYPNLRSPMHHYFYLHGFASGPKSAKAQFLGNRFGERQLDLQVPDLNGGDFPHLTLTRQLQQVARVLPEQSTTILGSSFGGLTAAWLGDRHPQVDRLILLAPAFRFMDCWLPTLGTSVLERWRSSGTLSVYHFGEKKVMPLHYEFAIDCQEYTQAQLQRPLETLILHGISDETIPIQVSRDYASTRPWVTLIKLESDHSLGNVMERIWQEIQKFCQL